MLSTPDDNLHLAKCSRISFAMEQGDISNVKGKTINQIDVTIEYVIGDVLNHLQMLNQMIMLNNSLFFKTNVLHY